MPQKTLWFQVGRKPSGIYDKMPLKIEKGQKRKNLW